MTSRHVLGHSLCLLLAFVIAIKVLLGDLCFGFFFCRQQKVAAIPQKYFLCDGTVLYSIIHAKGNSARREKHCDTDEKVRQEKLKNSEVW